MEISRNCEAFCQLIGIYVCFYRSVTVFFHFASIKTIFVRICFRLEKNCDVFEGSLRVKRLGVMVLNTVLGVGTKNIDFFEF